MTNPTIPMYPSESEYIDFVYTQQLRDGQTVASASYTIEATAPITKETGSEAVNSAGNTAQARFTIGSSADAGSQWTITCAATCASPVEVKILHAVVEILDVP